jgi:hypothetical protein
VGFFIELLKSIKLVELASIKEINNSEIENRKNNLVYGAEIPGSSSMISSKFKVLLFEDVI